MANPTRIILIPVHIRDNHKTCGLVEQVFSKLMFCGAVVLLAQCNGVKSDKLYNFCIHIEEWGKARKLSLKKESCINERCYGVLLMTSFG